MTTDEVSKATTNFPRAEVVRSSLEPVLLECVEPQSASWYALLKGYDMQVICLLNIWKVFKANVCFQIKVCRFLLLASTA